MGAGERLVGPLPDVPYKHVLAGEVGREQGALEELGQDSWVICPHWSPAFLLPWAGGSLCRVAQPPSPQAMLLTLVCFCWGPAVGVPVTE